MIRRSQQLTSESWKNLTWKQYRKDLFRLQKRVYKAVKTGETAKARSLQKLILRLSAARFLAIRQVTQLNNGRKTAGRDGKLALTYQERFKLEQQLKQHALNWKHQGLRSIPIPKKDGSKRILKVPTISDRAWQCFSQVRIRTSPRSNLSRSELRFQTRKKRTRRSKNPILKSKLQSQRIPEKSNRTGHQEMLRHD